MCEKYLEFSSILSNFKSFIVTFKFADAQPQWCLKHLLLINLYKYLKIYTNLEHTS